MCFNRLRYILRGLDTLVVCYKRENLCDILFANMGKALFSKKAFYLRGMKRAPKGSNFFPFSVDLFCNGKAP